MNKKTDIKISVIIPTFNRDKYFKPAIDSVINQNFPPDKCEILIVDSVKIIAMGFEKRIF